MIPVTPASPFDKAAKSVAGVAFYRSAMQFTEKDIARFWSKVDKSTEPNGCWLWMAGKTFGGYGRFWNGERKVMAHRFAYELTVGAIPDDYDICHNCDNPTCCNPTHLFTGTKTDNIQDAKRKNRLATGMRNGRYTHPESSARGSQNPRTKLTPALVIAIRSDHVLGNMTLRKLAIRYGVAKTTIRMVIKRITWKHI
jgi:hypothetical protein